jgi:hypothetical protein
VTITTLVYPALFRAPDWEAAHTFHRRAITPVVALVYGGLLAAAVLVLADGPSGPSTVAALAGIALSLTTTAFVAAPLHGRLSRSHDSALVRRLRVADLVRTSGALAALTAALLAVL